MALSDPQMKGMRGEVGVCISVYGLNNENRVKERVSASIQCRLINYVQL